MTALSYTKWSSMGDLALIRQIGSFVRHHRLEQNRTQGELARSAGISRSTLSLLEHGETVTLNTLIQVLRVLDQLQVMEAFNVETVVSPLLLAREEAAQRRRARPGKNDQSPTIDPW